MNLRRVAAVVADTAPVLVLAAIAGAGSFSHIRDTAAQHGQGGPMAWAVAVCIDFSELTALLLFVPFWIGADGSSRRRAQFAVLSAYLMARSMTGRYARVRCGVHPAGPRAASSVAMR